jgi:hypothetical protein
VRGFHRVKGDEVNFARTSERVITGSRPLGRVVGNLEVGSWMTSRSSGQLSSTLNRSRGNCRADTDLMVQCDLQTLLATAVAEPCIRYWHCVNASVWTEMTKLPVVVNAYVCVFCSEGMQSVVPPED